MQLPGRVDDRYYGNHCSILPIRWRPMASCHSRKPEQGVGELSSDRCRKSSLGVESEVDSRSTTSLTYSTYSKRHATPSDGNDNAARWTSFRAASSCQEGNPVTTGDNQDVGRDCRSEGDHRKSNTDWISKEKVTWRSVPVEKERDQPPEPLDWHEEKQQWISAAGVTTPAELRRKMEDMGRTASQNHSEMEQLISNFTVVKTFLLQLNEVEKDITNRKRRGERSLRRRRRKPFQRSRKCCSRVCQSSQDSSAERAEGGRGVGGSLLDPQIMACFGTLIGSSA